MSVEVFQDTPSARSYRFELLPEDAMASALELLDQPLADGVPDELDAAVERERCPRVVRLQYDSLSAYEAHRHAGVGDASEHVGEPGLRVDVV